MIPKSRQGGPRAIATAKQKPLVCVGYSENIVPCVLPEIIGRVILPLIFESCKNLGELECAADVGQSPRAYANSYSGWL